MGVRNLRIDNSGEFIDICQGISYKIARILATNNQGKP